MISVIPFTLTNKYGHPLTFQSGDLEVMLYVLEEDIFRVYSSFEQTYDHRQTWAVAPGMEDIPFAGRDRFDVTPFSLPDYDVEEEEGIVHVFTKKLKATVHLNGFLSIGTGKVKVDG
ncbi:alpha-glucosidase domain-containing protein [Litoribacterium kuwaitense]|uniref:alpha-glucosidase domain-containing protein n=1 Tax=Litoribacterium kuwaitense TaxID=1398745 RepID=UPI001FE74C70|nr:alpha-glucosidase domain-containing protein [Litoribacterium kuwaitense]